MNDTSGSRRDEILRIAARLFAERGFDATTTRQIGEAAGILSGSLYHHFSSKEAMLDEILAEFWAELLDSYWEAVEGPGTAADALRRLVRAEVVMIRRHRTEIAIVHNHAHSLEKLPSFTYMDRARAAAEEPWREIWERGKTDGSFRADLDTELTHSFVWGGLTNMTRLLVENRDLDDEAADAVTDLVLGAVLAPDDARAEGATAGAV